RAPTLVAVPVARVRVRPADLGVEDLVVREVEELDEPRLAQVREDAARLARRTARRADPEGPRRVVLRVVDLVPEVRTTGAARHLGPRTGRPDAERRVGRVRAARELRQSDVAARRHGELRGRVAEDEVAGVVGEAAL